MTITVSHGRRQTRWFFLEEKNQKIFALPCLLEKPNYERKQDLLGRGLSG
jgi:hypothetical protein